MVALQDGRVVAYLLAATYPTLAPITPLRSAIADWHDHAASGENAGELYRMMYAALSPAWLRSGHVFHGIFTPVGDGVVRDAWVSLGFGEELLFGRQPIAPMEDAPTPPGVEIRRGTKEDVDEAWRLVNDMFQYHARVPSYIPYLSELEGERRKEAELRLADPAQAYWLAYRDGRALGVQIFERLAMLRGAIPEGDIYLDIAQTEPAARGTGIGTALLAHGLAWAQAEGYTHCTVGWFSNNLSSDAFWRRRGFRPYLVRLVRLIDPRIAWAWE
jgi:GNAT superfamily N-acetyltransferase